MNLFSKDTKTAFEAKEQAQWIAFGPMVFQAARVLRNSGILEMIEESGTDGTTIEEITEKLKLSTYGARVLLEAGLSIGLVIVNDGVYTITKTGYFILHDPLTRINMDFVHDVNYKGMFYLDKSIETGKPEGLRELGEWPTVYEGLSSLPPQIQKSWFSFDHFFSDDAFPLVLRHVYGTGVKKLLDVGGNTGKWAIASTRFNDEVEITIMDLPGQLEVARKRIAELGLDHRVHFEAVNILDENVKFPTGHDAIWMSQFLDCFSEDEIVSILRRAHDALDENGRLFILEPFWDLQRFEVAAFCLHQTSLYFTALANGNSQMYSAAVFLACVEKAGFEVVKQVNGIGLSQTLLTCKKKN